jgi:hypothetical protein
MAQQRGLYTHGRIGSASHTRSKAMAQRVAQLTKRLGWPVRFARPSAAHRAAWPSRSGGPQCARTGATGHGHRGRSRRGGTGGHGLPVLVAGLGWWRKLEGASGRAPGKVSGGGAYPSGVPVVRRRSSGGRLHTSTPDVEVVAGRDPGEVLRLGRCGR